MPNTDGHQVTADQAVSAVLQNALNWVVPFFLFAQSKWTDSCVNFIITAFNKRAGLRERWHPLLKRAMHSNLEADRAGQSKKKKKLLRLLERNEAEALGVSGSDRWWREQRWQFSRITSACLCSAKSGRRSRDRKPKYNKSWEIVTNGTTVDVTHEQCMKASRNFGTVMMENISNITISKQLICQHLHFYQRLRSKWSNTADLTFFLGGSELPLEFRVHFFVYCLPTMNNSSLTNGSASTAPLQKLDYVL